MTTLYKCNKCSSFCEADEHKIRGKIYFGGRSYEVYASIIFSAEDDDSYITKISKDVHVCKNCLLNALAALDTRTKPPTISEIGVDTYEVDDIHVYTPPPLPAGVIVSKHKKRG